MIFNTKSIKYYRCLHFFYFFYKDIKKELKTIKKKFFDNLFLIYNKK